MGGEELYWCDVQNSIQMNLYVQSLFHPFSFRSSLSIYSQICVIGKKTKLVIGVDIHINYPSALGE